MRPWRPKRSVVSTTIGAEGLDIRPGENILIADRAEEFAERCLELLENEPARQRIADTAWELVQNAIPGTWSAVSSRRYCKLNSPGAVTIHEEGTVCPLMRRWLGRVLISLPFASN